MKRPLILGLDAIVNLILGVLLLFFPRSIVEALGVPAISSAFYPSILGAVLTGIGFALLLQIRFGPQSAGLGFLGALTINLCGGIALAGWLLWGELEIPVRGRIFLWSLVAVLLVFSLIESTIAQPNPDQHQA